MHKFILAIVIFVVPIISSAQADVQIVELADEMYAFGDVKDALEVYKQALELNRDNVKANLMAGRCYLETIHKEKSLPYLLKAYELDNKITFNILYLIGKSYQYGYNFEKAIEYFNQYRKIIDKASSKEFNINKKDELKLTQRRISECETAKALVEKKLEHIKIENLGNQINSEFPDYGPVITSDEKVIYFTSRRKGSTGERKDRDNEFFEDIYVSFYEDGNWSVPKQLDTTVNSPLHESSIGLSPDGESLFLYIDNNNHQADIFICQVKKDGSWTVPVPLGIKINTEYKENSITITADGSTIFFSSNKPTGVGGSDIYMSKRKKNGDWETPVNLGYQINTEEDEEGPFITTNGKTLYFSSKGHKGMGGFDLFKSDYDSSSGKWSDPVNLGYPINSPDDDVYFVLSGTGEYGYYASVKEDGVGNLDLYKITLSHPNPGYQQEEKESTVGIEEEKEAEVVLASVQLNLKIYSSDDQTPLSSRVKIIDKNIGTILKNELSENGNLTFYSTNSTKLPLEILIEKEGYIFKTVLTDIPPASPEKVIINKFISLDPITDGKRVVLRNIYYDFDEFTLKKQSEKELKKLLNLMNENKDIKICIDGHTDAIGSAAYNLELSRKRAESVVNWLISNGIDRKRLTFRGYGKTQPLASNDDENEGRELNRRTEFTVIKP